MNPIHYTSNFIKHYLNATFIDVLHSPFVFELYNDCIARKPYPAELKEIDRLWKQVRRSTKKVEHEDFGAKGRGQKQTKRVARIAIVQAKPKRIAQVLYNLGKKYQYMNCIELGTSLGYSTMHLAKPLPAQARLTTVEGAPALSDIASQNFANARLSSKIQSVTGRFNDVLPDILKSYETLDLGFIDGNHTYEATMDYFHQFLEKRNNNSIFIFDDIYWSKGMTQAWNEIKAHPEVTVTVDLFYIGLVFFRKEQRKQDFKLRLL